MENDRIERAAVRKIEEVVDYSPLLSPYIDRGDNFPIWDGAILVYNSDKKTNENYNDRINIQVKGTEVSHFSKEEIKYPFRVADLKAYLKDSGTIFFVVQVLKTGQTKAYYRSFLPIDLDKIINNIKPNQQSKSEKLYHVDDSSHKNIEKICKEFIHHRDLQKGTIKYKLKQNEMNEIKKVDFTVFDFGGKNIPDFLLNNEVMLYGYKKDSDIPLPFDYVKTKSISILEEKPISVDSKVFYNSYVVNKTKDNFIIEIGYNLNFDANKSKFEFKKAGGLNDSIRDFDFLSRVVHAGHFTLGNSQKINIHFNEENIERVNKQKKNLNNLKAILDFFNVEEDLNIDLLQDGDFKYLDFLINIILYNKKTSTEYVPKGLSSYAVGNVTLHTVTEVDEDGFLKIYNLFEHYKKMKVNIVLKSEENHECSIFVLFNQNIIQSLSDSQLETVEKDVLSINYSEEYAGRLNLLLLEIIKAYDTTKNNRYLIIASKISNWLHENSLNSPLSLINKLQVIKRQRALNSEEKTELRSFREKSSENDIIMCGMSILLENWSDFEYHFEKLTDEEKNTFQEYPIYRIGRDK